MILVSGCNFYCLSGGNTWNIRVADSDRRKAKARIYAIKSGNKDRNGKGWTTNEWEA